MNEKLLPCPVCGYDKPVILPGFYGGFYVHCPRYACPKEFMVIYPTKEQAIDSWNRAKRRS